MVSFEPREGLVVRWFAEEPQDIHVLDAAFIQESISTTLAAFLVGHSAVADRGAGDMEEENATADCGCLDPAPAVVQSRLREAVVDSWLRNRASPSNIR